MRNQVNVDVTKWNEYSVDAVAKGASLLRNEERPMCKVVIVTTINKPRDVWIQRGYFDTSSLIRQKFLCGLPLYDAETLLKSRENYRLSLEFVCVMADLGNGRCWRCQKFWR